MTGKWRRGSRVASGPRKASTLASLQKFFLYIGPSIATLPFLSDSQNILVEDMIKSKLEKAAAANHIAYCTGPYQLVTLICCMEQLGVQPEAALVVLWNPTESEAFVKQFNSAAEALGIQFLEWPNAEEKMRSVERPTTYWYCRAVAVARPPYDGWRVSEPNFTLQYYDSYNTALGLATSRKLSVSLKGPKAFARSLRDIWVARRLDPDFYIVPESDRSLWKRSASKEELDRTQFASFRLHWDRLREVGAALATHSSDKGLDGSKAYSIITTGMFAERNPHLSLSDELEAYKTLALTLKSVDANRALAFKPHPRTSSQKIDRLRGLCNDLDAILLPQEQFVEYLLHDSGRSDHLCIGPPSVSLVNAKAYSLAHPLCLGAQFLQDQFGEKYLNQQSGLKQVQSGHEYFQSLGIEQIESMDTLEIALRRYA